MKAKVFTRTLKTAGWNASFLVEQLKKYHFPEFVEIPFWADDFRNVPESHGCDKLVVYAWRWHGEWADPTKEVFARLYKPKKTE